MRELPNRTSEWKLHFLMMSRDSSERRNPFGYYMVSFEFRNPDELDLPDSKITHQISGRKEFNTREEAETACRFVLDNADDARKCKYHFAGIDPKDKFLEGG